MDLNVTRGEQVQVIWTAADLKHKMAAAIHDHDKEPVGISATFLSIPKSADESNRCFLRFVVATHVADTMPVNDVNRDLR